MHIKNFLKTVLFGGILSTGGAVNNTANVLSNATSSIEFDRGTGANYTSSTQLSYDPKVSR